MQPEFSERLYRAGHGEPLVLVHGFTATWRCWLPVLPYLVPRFEVIAPTLHGHDGGPVPPHAAHSLSEATDHLEQVLDELGVDTAHFAGNSMGGALSLELAKRGRARSVVAEVFETMREGSARCVDLDRIECPVLVTWGVEDRTLPLRRHAARFQNEIPGVRFRVMPGLGHTPMWDDAEQIAEAIAGFAEAAERAQAAASPAAVSSP